MNNDHRYAIAIGLISTSLLWKVVRYPVLEFMAHPLSLILAGIVVFYMYMLGYVATSVVIVMVALYLMREWSEYTTTPARKLYLDGVEDDARFNIAHSVDLQWAAKLVKHDPPKMLQPPIAPTEPLLTYPPSADTLFDMNG
jgi:uncharacterized membrane protein